MMYTQHSVSKRATLRIPTDVACHVACWFIGVAALPASRRQREWGPSMFKVGVQV